LLSYQQSEAERVEKERQELLALEDEEAQVKVDAISKKKKSSNWPLRSIKLE
jgi:hypothetical protein